jgi:hypothetical protein
MHAPGQEQFTRVCVLESLFEGQQLAAALGRARIPALVKSYHATVRAGIYPFPKGVGEIYVPVSRAVESETILDRARQEIRSTTVEKNSGLALRRRIVSEIEFRLARPVLILGQIALMTLLVMLVCALFSLPIWGGALLASNGSIVLLLWKAPSPERKPVTWPRWHRRPP